jgi:glycosyltransferase involved in cell wall biosynthesis
MAKRKAGSELPASHAGYDAPIGIIDRFISVVIPCYNEQDNIRPMYQRLTAVMSRLTHRYELVFVNNGSYDGSAPILAEIASGDRRVSVLTLSRNFGSQGAYTCGLETSRTHPSSFPRLR